MKVTLNDPIPGAPNFTWREVFASDTAARKNIDNTTENDAVLNSLIYVMSYVQKARSYFKEPMRINSGYRSPRLNLEVGGSSSSFHCYGQAVDLVFSQHHRSLRELFDFFYQSHQFTELIAEEISPTSGWIHFAISKHREQEQKTKYKLIGKSVVVASYSDVVKYAFS